MPKKIQVTGQLLQLNKKVMIKSVTITYKLTMKYKMYLIIAAVSLVSCNRFVVASDSLEEALANKEYANYVIIKDDSDIDLLDRIHELKKLNTLEIKNPRIKSLPQSVKFSNEIQFLTFIADSCEIPSQIGEIDSLFELVVMCRITEFPDLSKLKNLKTLKIQNSNLKSIPYSVLTIPNLRSLDLSSNKITFVPEDFFKANHSISELKLNFNPIKELPVSVFNSGISWLRLSNLELQTLPSNINFTGTSLDLGGNKLSSLPHDMKAENLFELFLGGNRFVEFPKIITTFSKLSRSLNLNSNMIKEIPGEIKNLNQLKRLELENNAIEIIPPEVGLLRQLEVLELRDNNLKSISFDIDSLKRLTRLNLIGNHLPIPEIDKLNKSKSRDKIVWTF